MALAPETDPSLPIPRPRSLPVALLIALRPKQWTKNLLLFAGLLFTLDQVHGWAGPARVGLSFLLFSALSGVVYLINDLTDRESDRRHPKKRFRPIASGELPPGVAWGAAIVLGVGGLLGAFALSVPFGIVALLYFLLTLAYTFSLKHIVLLDVMVLASGFVLRAIAGAVVVPVYISPWLVLCTLMLALFLGLSKRRAELLTSQKNNVIGTRKILTEYSAELLDQMIVIVTSACLMSYCLYTINSPAASRHPYLMLTIPFVIYGIFRYLYLAHRHALGESPESVILEDKPTLINVFLWAATTALIITLPLK